HQNHSTDDKSFAAAICQQWDFYDYLGNCANPCCACELFFNHPFRRQGNNEPRDNPDLDNLSKFRRYYFFYSGETPIQKRKRKNPYRQPAQIYVDWFRSSAFLYHSLSCAQWKFANPFYSDFNRICHIHFCPG